MSASISKLATGLWVFGATLVSVLSAHAAPGTLAGSPLVVSGYAEPNIMLLIDSSGSMNHVVPDSPYNAETIYVTCPSALAMGTANAILTYVDGDGDVYFRYGSSGTRYAWGTSSGTDISTGYEKRCFDPSINYRASLNAAAIGFTAAEYSGNYLNWYYSNGTHSAGDNFGVAKYKPGTEIRMNVAKTAATSLVNSLSDVRVGVAKYDGSVGARIVQGLVSVDDGTNRSSVVSAVSGIAGTGNTPLAEALQEIGRYFIQGKEGADLTMNPGQSYSSAKAGSSIFDQVPVYSNAGDEPSCSGTNCTNMAIQYWCQKSFVVGVTDGLPVDDNDTVSSDLKDYDRDCTEGSDTYKGKSSTVVGQCKKNSGETGFYDLKVGQDSESSDFLDDVAAAMWDMDLRPDLTDGNSTSNDAGDKQSVSTYMIGFADPALADSQLMIDTAAAGGGEYIAASNASQLSNAFLTATQGILAQSASVASVAFNSSTLSSDSAVYFARFNTSKWSGELLAFPLTSTGEIEPVDWEASERLDNGLSPSSRVIIANNGADGVPFRWTTAGVNPATPVELTNDLKMDTATATADANGEARLNYLRGDRALEATGSTPLLRQRSSRLGDIVNSTPVYVGAPQSVWPENTVNNKFGTATKPFSTFRTSFSSRLPVLYVGANDGMLHGFDARVGSGFSDRGKEVIAYVPNIVASTLASEGVHYLTSPNYQHRFYVDLTPTVADVYINTDPAVTPKTTDNASDQDWRTILIGGMRNGGKGYFALDVTDPTQFSEANAASLVLWEFTSANDADLGYTYSEPTVAMMNNGKWAVIFGNGYKTSAANDEQGKAKLFILFLENGKDGWVATDYVKISTGVGTAANINGLSSPQVADLDGNGTADRIYAGDLQGNLWVFDASQSNSGNWDVALKTSGSPVPLFTARDAEPSGNLQPITARPLLGRNVDNISGSSPNVVVMFGTGQYLNTSDISNINKQTFYVVADDGSKSLKRTNLQQRNFTESGGLRTSSNSQPAMNWTTYRGWYMDFNVGTTSPAIGAERVVSQALLRRRTLFFNTVIPDAAPCNSGGTGWLMALDFLTGLNPLQATFDANNDGNIDASDLSFIGQKVTGGLPARSGILGNQQYTPTSSGELLRRTINVGGSSLEGRLGWEEILPD